MVDVGDLGILAANYGMTSGATWAQGDFNGDGAVDVGDLGILAANYGTGSSSSSNFESDYAKVFRTTLATNDEVTSTDGSEEASESENTFCSGLGLSLIFGILFAGILLVKLESRRGG